MSVSQSSEYSVYLLGSACFRSWSMSASVCMCSWCNCYCTRNVFSSPVYWAFEPGRHERGQRGCNYTQNHGCGGHDQSFSTFIIFMHFLFLFTGTCTHIRSRITAQRQAVAGRPLGSHACEWIMAYERFVCSPCYQLGAAGVPLYLWRESRTWSCYQSGIWRQEADHRVLDFLSTSKG